MNNIRLVSRLDLIPENIFSKLGKLLKETELSSKRKVLNLGRGSPDFPPSKIFINKYSEYIKDPSSHLYPDFGANNNFMGALMNWYKTRFNVTLNSDELFPLLGAKDGTSHLSLAILNLGDEALIPDPGYPGYSDPTILFGGKPVFIIFMKMKNLLLIFKKLNLK